MSEPLKLLFVLRHARSWDHGLREGRVGAGKGRQQLRIPLEVWARQAQRTHEDLVMSSKELVDVLGELCRGQSNLANEVALD